jgi:hypothetical protein
MLEALCVVVIVGPQYVFKLSTVLASNILFGNPLSPLHGRPEFGEVHSISENEI